MFDKYSLSYSGYLPLTNSTYPNESFLQIIKNFISPERVIVNGITPKLIIGFLQL